MDKNEKLPLQSYGISRPVASKKLRIYICGEEINWLKPSRGGIKIRSMIAKQLHDFELAVSRQI